MTTRAGGRRTSCQCFWQCTTLCAIRTCFVSDAGSFMAARAITRQDLKTVACTSKYKVGLKAKGIFSLIAPTYKHLLVTYFCPRNLYRRVSGCVTLGRGCWEGEGLLAAATRISVSFKPVGQVEELLIGPPHLACASLPPPTMSGAALEWHKHSSCRGCT